MAIEVRIYRALTSAGGALIESAFGVSITLTPGFGLVLRSGDQMGCLPPLRSVVLSVS